MSGLSVLIVDDNEVDAELLQQIIEQHNKNNTVEWVWDGLEALVRIGEMKPDLILLDYMMPKTNGIEFLRNVRNLKAIEKTRVVIVSAFVEPGNTETFLELGADEVIAKPVEVKDIVDTLKKTEEQKRQRD